MNSKEILEKLIAFPTVCDRPNIELISFIQSTLADHGIVSDIFLNDAGDKANLFATIGPDHGGGIMLSGHTDVVSTDRQQWTFAPFRMTEADGRLYGRGTADMKGFVASALAAGLRARSRRLDAPLHLAFSFDEEAGCLGVHSMLRELARREPPRYCLVGEPTLMQMVTGHKGKIEARVTCTGLAAHSSLAPQAQNAIHLAADFIGALRVEQERLASEGARDAAYDLPYSTLHVGLIHGGRALNIVPDSCTLEFELRHLPEDGPEPTLERLRAAAERLGKAASRASPGAGIELEITNSYSGLDTPANIFAVRQLQAITGTSTTGKVAYGTEGGLFAEYLDSPCVICGPGSIMQAHKPDEFLELAQLERCDAMLDALIDDLSKSP